MGKYLIIIFLVGLFIYLGWRLFFKKEKKVRLPFSKKWQSYLLKNVLFYRELSDTDKDLFEQRVLYFLKKITITGVDTTINDIDKLLVATSGIIPIFGFPDWFYQNLNEVLLYKGTFNRDYETEGDERNILGMVGSGVMNRIMILSQPALHKGFENKESTNNVGIHEFVHLLDKSDGMTDGIPKIFLQKPYLIPWVKLIHKETNKIKKRNSDINPYGASNEAEFLSVVSEYFFKRPDLLEKKHPELYKTMKQLFSNGKIVLS